METMRLSAVTARLYHLLLLKLARFLFGQKTSLGMMFSGIFQQKLGTSVNA